MICKVLNKGAAIGLVFGIIAVGCRTPPQKETSKESAVAPETGEAITEDHKFPPNGTVLAAYTALNSPAAIKSAAFPSGSSLLHVKGGAGSSAKKRESSLALSGPLISTTSSIMEALNGDITQITDRTRNPVYLTVDSSGTYAVALYVNSTIGYYMPSSGNLASCSGSTTPVGGRVLPILDCLPIGSATSLIQDGSRYSNNQTIRSGSTFYYENGATFTSGSYAYYADSTTLTSGSTYYWPNGTTMASGSYLYYPTSSYLYSGSLYFVGGNRFSSSQTDYYISGSSLKSGSTYVYYPGGSYLKSSSSLYYPSGNLLASGGSIYTDNGSSNQQQITFAQSVSGSEIYVEAKSNSTNWLGVFQTESGSSFQSVNMGSVSNGLAPGTGTGSGGFNPPPSPNGANLVSVDDTTARVTWSSAGADTQSYIVRTIENPTSFLPNCVGGTAQTATSATVRNLKPNFLYAILICAVDSGSLMSPAAIVLAKPGTPVPPPVNLALTAVTGSSASLVWESPGSGVVSYSYLAKKYPEIPVDCNGGVSLGNVTSTTIGNLEDNATYYISVCAKNSGGSSSTPAVMRGKTLPQPPPSVSNLSGTSTLPGFIALNWTSGGQNTYQYAIAVGSSTNPPIDCSFPTQIATAPTATVSKLTPGSAYVVMVCAQTKNGSTAPGLTIPVTTLNIAADGLDFGGAMGFLNGGTPVQNPVTNAQTCPTGYSLMQFRSTANVDWPGSFCYRRRVVGGAEPALDFGGMFGLVDNVMSPNPLSGNAGCPTGYTNAGLEYANNVDAPLNYCYRVHPVGSRAPIVFGGIFGRVEGTDTLNPATGDSTCAPGFIKARVHGNAGAYTDANVFMCYQGDTGTVVPDPINLSISTDSAAPLSALNVSWAAGDPATAGYIVAYASGNTAPANCSNGANVGTATTYKLSNLASGTTYSVRVCAFNLAQTRSSGVVASGQTGVPSSTLLDPSFEAPSVGNGYSYTPTGSAWTFLPSSGLSGTGSAFTSGYGAPPQGSQVAFLQGTGSIKQTLTFPAGTYQLSLYAAQRKPSNRQTVVALIDTQSVATIVPGTSAYTQYTSARFNVTAGSHTITIIGTNPYGGDNTAFVDLVAIKLIDTTTPAGNPTGLAVTTDASAPTTALKAAWAAADQYTVGFFLAYAAGSTAPATCDGGVDVGAATSYSITNLTANTSYSVRVCAYNGSAAKSSGSTASGKTAIQVPVLADLSFETPSVGTGSTGFRYSPAGSPWTFISSAGLSGPASAFTGGYAGAPNGSQVAFLQGGGGVKQSVSFQAGTFILTFYAAQRKSPLSRQTVQVSIDSQVVATVVPGSSAYTPFTSSNFTVTAGSHSVTFIGTNPFGGDNTAFIDLVTFGAVAP